MRHCPPPPEARLTCLGGAQIETFATKYGERAIACLGVVGVTGVVAMSIMVESAPTERLMPCRE